MRMGFPVNVQHCNCPRGDACNQEFSSIGAFWHVLSSPNAVMLFITPLSSPTREARPMPSIPETNTKFCWICGRDAGLEHCITDEHGLAVHKSCHEKRMLQKAGSCRQWEVIARELSVEMNSERVLELSLELNR